METILPVIETLGFPVACVIFLGWFIYLIWNQQQKNFDKQVEDQKAEMQAIIANSEKREEKLYEQINKFDVTLKDFNTTLTRIDCRLEYLEKQQKDK